MISSSPPRYPRWASVVLTPSWQAITGDKLVLPAPPFRPGAAWRLASVSGVRLGEGVGLCVTALSTGTADRIQIMVMSGADEAAVPAELSLAPHGAYALPRRHPFVTWRQAFSRGTKEKRS